MHGWLDFSIVDGWILGIFRIRTVGDFEVSPWLG